MGLNLCTVSQSVAVAVCIGRVEASLDLVAIVNAVVVTVDNQRVGPVRVDFIRTAQAVTVVITSGDVVKVAGNPLLDEVENAVLIAVRELDLTRLFEADVDFRVGNGVVLIAILPEEAG